MTHTTSVRNMQANEGGRGNLAGFAISCACGWNMSTTLACDVQTIQAEHITYWAADGPATKAEAKRTRSAKAAATRARNRANWLHPSYQGGR